MCTRYDGDSRCVVDMVGTVDVYMIETEKDALVSPQLPSNETHARQGFEITQ